MINIKDNFETFNKDILDSIKPYFDYIDNNLLYNFKKIFNAFSSLNVSSTSLNSGYGYGISDDGIKTIEAVYEKIFNAEKAIVRPQLVSGTETLFKILTSLLEKGDLLLSITGEPYETLKGCIGINHNYFGNLINRGIRYSEISLIDKNDIVDYESDLIMEAKLLWIQKSCGYSKRRTISNLEIGKIVELVRKINDNAIIAVDNCYGEFVEKTEPIIHGVDLCAGSLLKNPGGGIARTGGYIAGKNNLIEKISSAVVAPGLGFETTPNIGFSREILQGLINAPKAVSESLKGNIYMSFFFDKLGYLVTPKYFDEHYDVVLKIELEKKEIFECFINCIQSSSPIDSFYKPEPINQKGYISPIVMAGGTFTPGSSIEFSADGFYRFPYTIFYQAGLYFEQSILLAEKFFNFYI